MDRQRFAKWSLCAVLLLCASAESSVIRTEKYFSVPIPAAGTKGIMSPAVIFVPNHGRLLDINITIDITHSCIFDLELYLVGPGSSRLCLNYYAYSEFFRAADYRMTKFDDESRVPVSQRQPYFTGVYQPRGGRLAVFDGIDPYGNWRLEIYDNIIGDAGKLNYVQLEMTVNPEPATIMFFFISIFRLGISKQKKYYQTLKYMPVRAKIKNPPGKNHFQISRSRL